MKRTKKWFVYDYENSFQTFDTQEEAEKEAQCLLDIYRSEASDGWADEVEYLCWGEVKGITQRVDIQTKEDWEKTHDEEDDPWPLGSDMDEWCDYELKKIENE